MSSVWGCCLYQAFFRAGSTLWGFSELYMFLGCHGMQPGASSLVFLMSGFGGGSPSLSIPSTRRSHFRSYSNLVLGSGSSLSRLQVSAQPKAPLGHPVPAFPSLSFSRSLRPDPPVFSLQFTSPPAAGRPATRIPARTEGISRQKTNQFSASLCW